MQINRLLFWFVYFYTFIFIDILYLIHDCEGQQRMFFQDYALYKSFTFLEDNYMLVVALMVITSNQF